ncbi:aryl-alcohol dehydrogenase [Lentinula raphanica]|uniref:Aryl-alcohol dehydrogenase n=1 Tax=Lentinula raphanica TaxID=153919 RepID=A0AA38PLM4_9AGAR|nr:aryl-alcohol dehydrogenase [Lentinula raphanica]KAJ3844991.1 aryl-alcohol dehydrogenase [Lentinula raphanica]KAJ3973586.1 aryl-alcohol dehydrogenase [Lentinula raphanica]
MASSTKQMTYSRLGNSGLKVSRIILGTMQYGSPEWQPWVLGNEEEAIKHIKTAYDAGIQTFDTADVWILTFVSVGFQGLKPLQVYSNGLSEVILGKAIKQLNLPRDEIVVMTKCFFVVGKTPADNLITLRLDPDTNGYVNQHGLSRKHIFAAVKNSLKRLQLEYIDVLQCHRFDPDTPIPEVMQALHDVVQAGYVRYIGMSSCWAWQFHAMQSYAINNKLTPFISMQNHYNLIYREEEKEMFPTLKYFGVGAIPWSPLARGLLTRPMDIKTTRGDTDWFIGKYTAALGTEEIIKRVEQIAKKKNISMAQVAVAWTLAKEGVTASIVGTTSLRNLEDIIAGIHVILDAEEIKFLEESYKPTEVIGHM